jgi:hypothetical protein
MGAIGGYHALVRRLVALVPPAVFKLSAQAQQHRQRVSKVAAAMQRFFSRLGMPH